MNDTRPNVESRTLSLYPNEWEALLEIAKQNGLASMSAAVRYMLNDYRKLRAQILEPASLFAAVACAAED
jgi:hypothetical protein